MSNICQFDLRIENLDSQWYYSKNPRAEKFRLFASQAVLNPVLGLKIEVREDGHRSNENGGQTPQVVMRIWGEEAMSYRTFDFLKDVLQKYGTITMWNIRDIEENPTDGELPDDW